MNKEIIDEKIKNTIKWAAEESTNGIFLYGCLRCIIAPIIILIIGGIICAIANLFS